MRCPECNVAKLEVLKLTETLYRLECTSICCYYVEEFEYVAQEPELTDSRDCATLEVTR